MLAELREGAPRPQEETRFSLAYEATKHLKASERRGAIDGRYLAVVTVGPYGKHPFAPSASSCSGRRYTAL
jgi:hypothetical protein